MASDAKKKVLESFARHVSAPKAAFFTAAGMDFIPGRREGPWLWDMDGEKRLFNLHCNGGVYNLGHRNPEILRTLAEGMAFWDIGNGHLMSRARAGLAETIASLMPGDLDVTIFGVSGGEAVDLAIKVARGHTKRAKIVSVTGGYHGHTGLALAAGDPRYREPFGPQAPGFVQVPFGDEAALARAVDADTAAVILETVPATLGMAVPPPGYIAAVRGICDRAGALYIADEVQTGLSRTGKLWGFTHFGVVPDVVVLGKGLSGGVYPITATVIRKPLEALFEQDPFLHVSTFGGAELGCLVAQKVLEISSAPAFLAHVNELAAAFAQGVAVLAEKHRILTGLRQLGLFMGLELEDEAAGPLLSLAAYQNDLLMVYANNNRSVCQFLPPLVMETDRVPWVLERLDRALGLAQSFKDGL
ncbi:MAG: aminotransferase class III-fold pyridoxal phosphate-dependent enzyme [Pseudomonadota bacterium]